MGNVGQVSVDMLTACMQGATSGAVVAVVSALIVTFAVLSLSVVDTIRLHHS